MTETERKTLVVDESGAGDYRTLTEAVAACAATPDEPVRFYIRHGIYEERPFIELADYVIEGEYRNATVITASVGGRDPWPGEVKTGTFRSATLFLGGGRAVVRNLTVQNNAGGRRKGRSGAGRLRRRKPCADGECEPLRQPGHAVHRSPAPAGARAERLPRPRENTPRLDTMQYYKNCTIRGNIDFIFGGANAVFDTCRLEPWHHISGICYITAPSTPAGKPGYLFVNCTVQGSCAPGSVYLGRPWRADAACYWLDCALSDEVCAGRLGQLGVTPRTKRPPALVSTAPPAPAAPPSAPLAAWMTITKRTPAGDVRAGKSGIWRGIRHRKGGRPFVVCRFCFPKPSPFTVRSSRRPRPRGCPRSQCRRCQREWPHSRRGRNSPCPEP